MNKALAQIMNTAAVFACQEPWPLQSTLNNSAGASQQSASTLVAPKPGGSPDPSLVAESV